MHSVGWRNTKIVKTTCRAKRKYISRSRSYFAVLSRGIRSMRRLQLLIQVYNQAYCYVHFNAKIFCLGTFIMNTSFGILRMHQKSHAMAAQYLFFGIKCAAVYCTMFHKAFAFPTVIRKFRLKVEYMAKQGILESEKRKEILRWIRSVPPVGIKVGIFHTFERMSTPNFLGFGIRNIVRVLIAFRNE